MIRTLNYAFSRFYLTVVKAMITLTSHDTAILGEIELDIFSKAT